MSTATLRYAESATPALSHDVTLKAADGERMHVACGTDVDVVTAAADAGLVLPSMCRKGTCGACHAHVVAGEYELDSHSSDVLGPTDEGKGAVLLCRTRPKGSLTIELPYDSSRILSGAVPVREAEIVSLEEVAAATVRLVLSLGPDAEGGLGAQFEPGQFVQLEIPGESERRANSLANVANWDGVVELLIKRQPGGWFSSYLEKRAKVGDRLVVHGPQGAFGLRETGLRPRWFIAGGTGLSPLLSMLRRMAEWQEPHETRLYFGVNTSAEVFGVAELDALRAQLPGFDYEIRVWRADGDWTGAVGTPVDGLRRDLATATKRPDLYVCGPPRLIDATFETAAAHGLDEHHVFAERFLPT
ncbi:MAG: 2Fe-2S iron-sulfur cluster binding domain-containing protein [Polyangiaceae bacterium]|nr:2Fe-2S iron-sulfur cluster binding domain-containing protein [Polyangiaceae bacterium]